MVKKHLTLMRPHCVKRQRNACDVTRRVHPKYVLRMGGYADQARGNGGLNKYHVVRAAPVYGAPFPKMSVVAQPIRFQDDRDPMG